MLNFVKTLFTSQGQFTLTTNKPAASHRSSVCFFCLRPFLTVVNYLVKMKLLENSKFEAVNAAINRETGECRIDGR